MMKFLKMMLKHLLNQCHIQKWKGVTKGWLDLQKTCHLMIEGLAANLEGIDSAQAPSTPGLMEEPNVSSVKEVLACDDHLESEDHNLRRFLGIESSENAYNKSDLHDRDGAIDLSLGDNSNHNSVVCLPTGESSHPSGDLEVNQTALKGDLLSTSVTTEHISSDWTVSGLDGLDMVEDASRVVSCNNEETVPSVDRMNGECEESTSIRLRETNDGEIFKNMEDSHSNEKTVVSNVVHLLGSPSAPNSVNVEGQGCQGLEDPKALNDSDYNERMPPACTGVLWTCNAHLNEPDTLSCDVRNSAITSDLQSAGIVLLSTESLQGEEEFHASGTSTKVQGQECHVIDVVQSEEKWISEPTLSGEIQADGEKQEEQLDNAISNNQCSDLNSSMTSDLPAPEKLLFAPQRLLNSPHDLLVETPDKEVRGEGDESGAQIETSGKKRGFAESCLTVQSIKSVESFDMTRSKRAVDSVPDDDDLLSSILVGRRSSVLKMKPTPPIPEVRSVKRVRSSSRSTALKRKVLMDDSMVLHGDTIRQQLTNTEDIRRMRKKAPCTRTEILIIQRQSLEEEIFCEPVLTGILPELTHLNGEAFDLSRIRISENDDINNNAFLEALSDEDSAKQNVILHNEIEGSTEPGSCRSNLDGQSSETPIQNDNHQRPGLIGSNDFVNKEHINGITDSAGYRTSEHEYMGEISEIVTDNVNAIVVDAGTHDSAQGLITCQSEPVPRDTFEMATGTVDRSDIMDKMFAADDFVQMEASNLPSDKIDTRLVEEVISLRDMGIDRGFDGVEVLDHSAEQIVAIGTELGAEGIPLDESKVGTSMEVGDFLAEGSAHIDEADSSLAKVPSETGGCISFSLVNVDQALDEIGNDKNGTRSEDGGLAVTSGCIDVKDQISNHLCNDESEMDSACMIGPDGDFKSTSMNGDDTVCQQIDHQSAMDTQNTPLDHVTTACDDFQDTAFANNTEFLNVDGDEMGEDDEEGMPNAEDTRLLENSGWSSRTRAVAKYLQTLFDKKAGHGKVLSMDNLLAGKTRKEASRMFFETLVLATRDYVHVEQAKPFDNINIKPRAKLVESDF
ncbi:sister chromatid cohesion 1 protein 4 isoform X3 [Manihot esculenta]|uniref:sister chromatid cohesion 1 protein 4 isoform X3 n=1 Tax=Manihot esculenta TaxID=3983 RepID=UPI000B5D5803|nr:sister chromatid cohesion 1 protein 4 isoform X3 [Manihot esculenta]XP_021630524.1 sister chromatid cohesion 1 protein 4 isoform X3 [Manihot esculenta]